MSPGRSATCMILTTAAMAEQRGGCHHYKYHPKSPPRVRRCSCFRVECRSSKTASVRRHPSVDSPRPSRGSKGSIHRPPNDRSDCCVLPFKVAESQDDRRTKGRAVSPRTRVETYWAGEAGPAAADLWQKGGGESRAGRGRREGTYTTTRGGASSRCRKSRKRKNRGIHRQQLSQTLWKKELMGKKPAACKMGRVEVRESP